jgi:glycine cleavage system H protein
MTFPDNCKYTDDHEWIRIEGGNIAFVGITDYAQGELGDIVYVDIDSVGKTLDASTVFGTIEAVKTTSDLFLPMKAKVLEVNKALDGTPSLVNTDPYGDGWIVKVEISNLADYDKLMTPEDYQKHVGA